MSVKQSRFIPLLAYLLILSFVIHMFLILQLIGENKFNPAMGFVTLLSYGISLYKFCTRDKRIFVTAILLHPFLSFLFLMNLPDHTFLLFLYTSLLVIEGSLFLDLPWNLAASAYPVIIQIIFFKFWFSPLEQDSPVFYLLQYFFALTVLCFSSVLSVFYREKLIRRNKEIAQLKETLLKLNRTNRDFQDSLFRIAAESSEEERKRITRDIHDLVGYTMTNNIVLMEMATDLMKTDPLEVSRIINTARKNAQSGLEEIRGILYNYRKENPNKSEGLKSISRQAQVFETAAEIEIHFNPGNCPLSFGWDLDSVIYHMVQESILNAYCHGLAFCVDIFLYQEEKVICITVQDNGTGAENLVEGIGIKGMRERLEMYGGTLEYGNNALGFIVNGYLPRCLSGEEEVNGTT